MYDTTQLYQSCFDLKVWFKNDKKENNSYKDFFDVKYCL